MKLSTRRRKTLAFILAFFMIISTCFNAGIVTKMGYVFAEEAGEDIATASDAQQDEQPEAEAEADQSVQPEAEANADQNVQPEVEEEEEEQLESDGVVASELGINFVVVEEARFDTPASKKYIVVDMEDGSAEIDQAEIILVNEITGVQYAFDVDTVLDSSLLFYVDFPDNSYTGVYKIKSVLYTSDGIRYEKLLSDEDMAPKFGVNADADTDPDGWMLEDGETAYDAELEKSVVDLSSDFKNANAYGTGISVKSNTKKNNSNSNSMVFSKSPGNVVVVLDPGHGGSDSGASYTWNGVAYIEKELNQIIADACKEELEKYSNVTVYMTRSSASEALHGSVGEDLQWRCDFAHEMEADLFVALHCNSSMSVNSATGAEVFIPNSSYNTQVYNVAKTVGTEIGKKLVALGLTNGATYTRNTANGSTYDDGSVADYYAVIKHCKEYGIPGLIVEHAYINNSSDCIKFFGTNEKLKELGKADAQGIAANLGLLEENRVSSNVKANGWRKSGSGWVYYKDGKISTGFFTVDGKKYYAKNNGLIVTGWNLIKGSWYYFDSKGVMAKSQWMKNKSGSWQYIGSDGKLSTGVKEISGSLYFFNSDGAMMTGWQQSGNDWYYARDNGTLYRNSWFKSSSGYWYYFKEDGKMATGKICSGGVCYYMSSAGTMRTGWINEGGNWCYANEKTGALYRNGWGKSEKGYWYYFDENCYIKTGWISDGGVPYYLSSSGEMQTGWINIGNDWYYASKTGAVYKNGWMKSDKGYWYYFDADKKMVTGKQTINGSIYYFSSSGEMQSGWISDEGKWHFANANTGALVINGWMKSDKGYWYYFDKDGNMYTGIKNINEKNYLFAESGELQEGWIKHGDDWYHTFADGALMCGIWHKDGSWYYFDGDGKMATGTRIIDNKRCYFDNNGVFLRSEEIVETDTSKLHAIMGNSTRTADELAARFIKEDVEYPTEIFKAGGAADIKTFCKIIVEESNAEGVKAEVVFAQAMHETGWLQFGGDVKAEQYNFCGLGATGGVAGESYKDIRTGIRAQVQHLKAYASKDDLKQECVDTRFKYVERGCAKYVEYLGQKENPTHKGWATAEGYGNHIMNIIYSMDKSNK